MMPSFQKKNKKRKRRQTQQPPPDQDREDQKAPMDLTMEKTKEPNQPKRAWLETKKPRRREASRLPPYKQQSLL
jgi:hypothetical protein